MFSQGELVILLLALHFKGEVHAGEIAGGHEAVPHSRPYMVLLKRQMQDKKTQLCDGFLLNEEFVMTAAHCNASSFTASLGVHNIYDNNEMQEIPVEKAFPHEDYKETDLKNDIMLLKLSSKANFSKNVKPIGLPDQDDDSLPKSCIVSGWGLTGKNNDPSSVLMEVNVTLIDPKQCPKENCYCAEGEAGPRKGDSGGPLVCDDDKAYGIVSCSGKPNPNGPQVYAFTKISHYEKWINSTMEHHGTKKSVDQSTKFEFTVLTADN